MALTLRQGKQKPFVGHDQSHATEPLRPQDTDYEEGRRTCLFIGREDRAGKAATLSAEPRSFNTPALRVWLSAVCSARRRRRRRRKKKKS